MGYISRTAGSGVRMGVDGGGLPCTISATSAELFTPAGKFNIPPVPNDIQWLEFYRIPVGSRNIHFKLNGFCGVHTGSIITIHERGGALLTGCPISMEVLSKGVDTTGVTDSELLSRIDSNINNIIKPNDAVPLENYINNTIATRSIWLDTSFANPISRVYDAVKAPSLDSLLTFPFYPPNLFAFRKVLDNLKGGGILDSTMKCSEIGTSSKALQIDTALRTYVGDMLHTLWPSIFPAGFILDDRHLMGTGQMVAKYSDAYRTFTFDYETINWTGNTTASLSFPSGYYTSDTNSDMEELFIEEAKCTLIIGVITNHYIQSWEASWDECTDSLEDPCYDLYGDEYPGGDPPIVPEPTPDRCFRPRLFRVRKARQSINTIEVNNADFTTNNYTKYHVWDDTHAPTQYCPEQFGKFWKVPKGAINIRFELPFLLIYREFFQRWLDITNPLKTALASEIAGDSTWTNLLASDPQSYWQQFWDEIYERANEYSALLSEFSNAGQGVASDNGYLYYPSDGSLSKWLEIWLKGLTPPATGIIPAVASPSPLIGSTAMEHSFHPEADHSCSIQVFLEDGTLLAGTPITGTTAKGSSMNLNTASSGTPFNPPSANTKQFEAPTRGSGCLWPAWYFSRTIVKNATWTSTHSDSVTPAMLSAALQSDWPNVFQSGFMFNDADVNGDGKELYKSGDIVATDMQSFTSHGQAIRWSGCPIGGHSLMSSMRLASIVSNCVDYWAINSGVKGNLSSGQLLTISEARENLIIGAISPALGCPVYGRWQEIS